MRIFSSTLLPLLAICLSMQSCSKKRDNAGLCQSDCITISGRITSENNSVVPVKSARVYLTWSYYGLSIFQEDTIQLGEVFTNADGYYYLSSPFGRTDIEDGEFAIHVQKDDHLFMYPYTFTLAAPDTSFAQNFHLPRRARIEITIKGFENSHVNNKISVFPSYDSYMGGQAPGNLIEVSF